MIVSTMVTPILVYNMPKLVMAGRELLVLTTLGIIDEVFSTLEFVSLMSFHAQVSDPILGGVYMTLLNSGANFGGMWPESTGKFTQIVNRNRYRIASGGSRVNCVSFMGD